MAKMPKKLRKQLKSSLVKQREQLTRDIKNLKNQIDPFTIFEFPLTRGKIILKTDSLDEYAEGILFGLVEAEKIEIKAIDKALEKMEDGSYGDCAECGVRIDTPRLKAIPSADLCIVCKRKEEEALQ